MAEKNGAPRLTASAETSGRGQQPEQQRSVPPTAISSDTRQSGEADGEVVETMELRHPSDMHHTPRGMLDRSLQAQLGRQLRAVYSDIAEEPVPDRFVKLLEALEAREKKR